MTRRVAISAVSVLLGWVANLLLHALIFTGAGTHDAAMWRLWTGLYAGSAYAFVALPVAVRGSPPPSDFAKLCLLGGGAGAMITVLPPAVALFPFSTLIGAAAGVVSAACYSSILTLSDEL